MVEYLSKHHGDFYAVPVQVFGLPNVGCPFACLKTNFSHTHNKGLEMTANRELKELQAQQVRAIAKERLQSAINSLQRAMYDLEVYSDKFDNASTDYERGKVVNYAINHLYCNIPFLSMPSLQPRCEQAPERSNAGRPQFPYVRLNTGQGIKKSSN
jgi:hypothetical protein